MRVQSKQEHVEVSKKSKRRRKEISSGSVLKKDKIKRKEISIGKVLKKDKIKRKDISSGVTPLSEKELKASKRDVKTVSP